MSVGDKTKYCHKLSEDYRTAPQDMVQKFGHSSSCLQRMSVDTMLSERKTNDVKTFPVQDLCTATAEDTVLLPTVEHPHTYTLTQTASQLIPYTVNIN